MAGETSIILCADDYAMSEGVSRGIVALARAGRISATSVMANSPAWPGKAEALRGVGDRVAVGLHLTLTWGRPLGPMRRFAPGGTLPSLGAVVRASLVRRLPVTEIGDEISRQLDVFEATWGAPPAFIDGHQHVHALPGIRSALLTVASQRGLAGRVWLRDPADGIAAIIRRGGAWSKALVVAALSMGFGTNARGAGFRTNDGFAGFSSFATEIDVEADFRRYVAVPGRSHLVMCHPGEVDGGETLDGVAAARRLELAFLASDAFPKLLAERRISLASRLASGS